jgi:phosphohistidine phosphatase
MLLYLLRHAEPDSNPAYQDHERPLTEIGRVQAAIVATFLKKTNHPIESILSSPYLRAMQTADKIAGAFPTATLTAFEPLAQSSSTKLFFRRVNESSSAAILVVGHEPQLVRLASILVSGSKDLGIELKKCSLACIETEKPLPSKLAILKWLITFEQMKLATSA